MRPKKRLSENELRHFRNNVRALTYGKMGKVARAVGVSRRAVLAAGTETECYMSLGIALGKVLGVGIGRLCQDMGLKPAKKLITKAERMRLSGLEMPSIAATEVSAGETLISLPEARDSATTSPSLSTELTRRRSVFRPRRQYPSLSIASIARKPKVKQDRAVARKKIEKALKLIQQGHDLNIAAKLANTSRSAVEYHLRQKERKKSN